MLINKSTLFFFIFILVFFFCGCASTPYKPLPEKTVPKKTTPETQQPEPEKPAPDARLQAAERLLTMAKDYLDKQKPDDAINFLERAIGLDPKNGQSYYFLAEAWQMKGNPRQALEFNRLAGIYLNGIKWEIRVSRQKTMIENMQRPSSPHENTLPP